MKNRKRHSNYWESFEHMLKARTVREAETGCLVWIGAASPRGLTPQASCKPATGHCRPFRVRPYMWEQAKGEIPRGQVPIMTCGNGRCLELSHCVIVGRDDPRYFRQWLRSKTEAAWHQKAIREFDEGTELLDRFAKNYTLDAIGKRHGVTRERVRQVLRAYGRSVRTRHLDAAAQ